jgi:hypothetical protein
MRLRVFPEKEPEKPYRTLRGCLPDFPELTWKDFEAGGRLAIADLGEGQRTSSRFDDP